MQVGEVGLGSRGAVQGLDVGFQLHQITRHEACCETLMAHDLNQQPCRVAAGPGALPQGFLAGLDARLHADQIADVLLQPAVELDQKINDIGPLAPIDTG